jgi:hypothetical protein
MQIVSSQAHAELYKPVLRDSCGHPVRVSVRPRAALNSVWAAFECPHCEQSNFQRLPGQVITVSRLELD